VSKQIITEIELDVPGDDNDGLACQEREDPRDDRETHDQPGPLEKICARNRLRFDTNLQLVDGPAEEPRLEDCEKVAANDRENPEQQSPLVASKIRSKAQKRAHDDIKMEKSNGKMTNENHRCFISLRVKMLEAKISHILLSSCKVGRQLEGKTSW
jgi:hypothetical protein